MERLNKENADFFVETHYGLFEYRSVHEDKFCTWEEALGLFQNALQDEDVAYCFVFYLDSKGNKRAMLSYDAPLDY